MTGGQVWFGMGIKKKRKEKKSKGFVSLGRVWENEAAQPAGTPNQSSKQDDSEALSERASKKEQNKKKGRKKESETATSDRA